MALNDKQLRFCQEYLIDLNGTQAAIRAGYSVKSAASIANENLTKPEIQSRISELQKSLSTKTEVTLKQLIDEYKKIAFSNIIDYLEDDNEIADINSLPRELGAVVESVKKTITKFDGGTKSSVQLKLHSKIAGLEALGKHLGFFEKDNSQKALAMIPPTIIVHTNNTSSDRI